jgi:hypothetical protein
MSLIRNPPVAATRRLIPSDRRLPTKPNLGFWLRHQCSKDDDRTLDDTRRSSNAHLKLPYFPLEFDGACNTAPAANQARVEEQTAVYARAII